MDPQDTVEDVPWAPLGLSFAVCLARDQGVGIFHCSSVRSTSAVRFRGRSRTHYTTQTRI
jgi:hypothetical protein